MLAGAGKPEAAASDRPQTWWEYARSPEAWQTFADWVARPFVNGLSFGIAQQCAVYLGTSSPRDPHKRAAPPTPSRARSPLPPPCAGAWYFGRKQPPAIEAPPPSKQPDDGKGGKAA